MNRMTVRANIFKLMKRVVLSFMILCLQFGRVVVVVNLHKTEVRTRAMGLKYIIQALLLDNATSMRTK